MYFNLTAFGDQLRHMRTSSQMTQLEIALEAEIDQSFYSMIERGRTGLSLQNFVNICSAFHISPEDMLGQILQQQ